MVYGGALASGALAHESTSLGWHTRLRRVSRRRRSPACSATSSARSPAGGSASTAAAVPRAPRPLVPPHARAARARRALVRALGRLGGARRARHAGRALVRLDPGRRLREPASRATTSSRSLGNAIWCLVLAGDRLGARVELGQLPPRLPVRRVRRRGGNRARGGVLVARRRRAATISPAMTIPHVDVKAQYAPLIPELKEAFARTLETGRFIFGPGGRGVRARSRREARHRRRRSAARTAPTRSCSCSTRWGSAPATR